jgi:hypothetical protein
MTTKVVIFPIGGSKALLEKPKEFSIKNMDVKGLILFDYSDRISHEVQALQSQGHDMCDRWVHRNKINAFTTMEEKIIAAGALQRNIFVVVPPDEAKKLSDVFSKTKGFEVVTSESPSTSNG